MRKRIIKIVLTGGPMAGKSSILLHLEKYYSKKVQVIPEIATSFERIFFKNHYFFTKSLNNDLNKLFFFLQLRLEAIYSKVAKEKNVKILVCDRGLFDGAAYCNGGVREFLSINNTSPKEMYDQYDVVIYLESLLKIDEKKSLAFRPLMKKEKNLILKISNSNLKNWKHHQNFHYVNGKTLKEKKIEVLNIINSFLG